MKLKSKTAAKTSVHFIGIGGIGMSALAQYYLAAGLSVSGSDLAESEIVKMLREKGAGIVTGVHRAGNIPKAIPKVIVSNAIDSDNEEFRAAKRRQLKIQKYSEAIGELTKKYQTIAVCGAHGKSTTTALTALVLEKAGLDPTVIVGTKLHEWNGGNFRMGKGKYLILEADEHKEAFLKYVPQIIIATNIDKEHLDHYQTLDRVKKAFRKFFAKLPSGGILIANKDDPYVYELGRELDKTKFHKVGRKDRPKIIWYSLKSSAADSVRETLKIFGKHNLSNALAVLALAKVLKIPEHIAFEVFQSYRGSWRRGEYKGKLFGASIYDDYAHHPTEIRATLAGFREKYPMSRIWCVFQPHQEARLRLLFEDFVGAFAYADQIILLDAYRVAGREFSKLDVQKRAKPKTAEIPKTSFELAVAVSDQAHKPVFYIQHASELKRLLQENVFEHDVVIMMGAGNINEITKTLVA